MTTTNSKATETMAYSALRLAQIHAETTTKPMASSAKLAAEDAECCFNRGDFDAAYNRAKTSLRYSIGVLHADF